jgi:ABC-2 type transport system ATP-binding protein
MTCEALGRFVGGFYPSWDGAEFERLLDVFELPARRKVSELSHGTRVKLALALAIAPRPPLLILDEPTAGLDPVARREFLEITERHAHAAGQTVFFSSHLVDEVERVADRVGIIDRGRLVYEGDLEELRRWVRGVAVESVSPLEPPPLFRVLRQAPGEPVVLMAAPQAWDEHPELRDRAAAQKLSLDDMFIALVGRMPEA